MALPTITKTLDDLHSSTWEKVSKNVVDNIFDEVVVLNMLKKRGKLVDHSGDGVKYIVPLEYGENKTVTSIGRGSSISIEDNPKFTAAQYDRKWTAGSVIRYMTDEDMNMGEARIFNLVEKNIKNLEKSLKKKLNTDLMGDGTGNGGLDLDGFKLYIDTTPATGTVGGIDSATNPWWRNHATNMTGQDYTVTLIDQMRTMFNNCSSDGGADAPNLIITTQAIHEYYEDELFDTHYYTQSNELADAGISTCNFKGVPMIWTSGCDDYYMYFINLDYFEAGYNPNKWFTMTDWKSAQANLERVAQVVSEMNLICSNRDKQGILYNIGN